MKNMKTRDQELKALVVDDLKNILKLVPNDEQIAAYALLETYAYHTILWNEARKIVTRP